jgi:cardiolipin synthase A/B
MLGLSLVTILHLLIALPLCGHVLLRKEQEPVAVGWIALILLSPFIGSALYGLFGINRIARKAQRLRVRKGANVPSPTLPRLNDPVDEVRIMRIAGSATDLPFLQGNAVKPLINGDEAFPAMLAAIAEAKTTITISTYIFDNDVLGRKFVAALTAAAKRGVRVRVLIDDIGLLYSQRAIDDDLRAGSVDTARFIPREIRFIRTLNLRNHRKVMVVDGQVGFIGGMNLRHGHVLADRPRSPIQDIHFEVTGPVLDQFTDLFAEDWHFAAEQEIELPRWNALSAPAGSVTARLVADGPDHRSETLQWLLLGALASAQKHVQIMTPYFIPNGALVSALCVTAMRGVRVEIIVPAHSNIPFIGWAMAANFERLMSHGVAVFLGSAPFDHSKVMVVDGHWSLVGSTNWDQRSLRLNFEANLECTDTALAAQLGAYFDDKRARATAVSWAAVQAAPLAVRLRNNFVRLFSPYL